MKAFGRRLLFPEICVRPQPAAAPLLETCGAAEAMMQAANICSRHLSISHERPLVTAFVILQHRT